jgi:hypothetical protein
MTSLQFAYLNGICTHHNGCLINPYAFSVIKSLYYRTFGSKTHLEL